jgi:hypothetical protein
MRSIFTLDRMADEAYEWKKQNGMLGTEQHENTINISEEELEDLR